MGAGPQTEMLVDFTGAPQRTHQNRLNAGTVDRLTNNGFRDRKRQDVRVETEK
jgi:hypothetical protein